MEKGLVTVPSRLRMLGWCRDLCKKTETLLQTHFLHFHIPVHRHFIVYDLLVPRSSYFFCCHYCASPYSLEHLPIIPLPYLFNNTQFFQIWILNGPSRVDIQWWRCILNTRYLYHWPHDSWLVITLTQACASLLCIAEYVISTGCTIDYYTCLLHSTIPNWLHRHSTFI